MCLVGILCNLSTPWSNIDWQYWPWVSGCTNYIRSIVGDEYCLTRQKRLPREATGCLSGQETLTMRWMFAVQYGLEQGSKMNGFYLKQGQGLKASVANPYPNFHKCFPSSRRPWNSNCLLLCLDFFFTWDPNRFSLKVFWTCKGNLWTSLIWLLDIFFFFSEATVEINKVAHHINENIRQRENFQKMLSIQNALTGEGAPKILAPGNYTANFYK